MHPRLFAAGALAATLLAGCSQQADGTGYTIEVAPLELPGISEAIYALTVSAGGQTVWARSGIRSTEFGDGRGAISYIGTCDASFPTNTVTLQLESLWDGAREIVEPEYRNPGPLSIEAPCNENRDTPVVFNLTLMRAAEQGFFDIGVNFSDIFCSAKFDCKDELLHDPRSDERGLTGVLAFACTAGAGQQTTLYLNDLRIDCDGPPARSWYVDPSGGPGQMGPLPAEAPVLFETATYFGQEQLPGYDKCFWNTAMGLDLAALGPSCTLHARGTAADQPFGGPGRQTPPDTIYPVVEWSVPLTDASGKQACGAHPLNGADGLVKTAYTDFSGESFTYEMACNGEPDPEDPGRLACTGTSALGPVSFTQTADGVVVAAQGHRARFPLAPGLSLATCCGDPCCTTAP